MARCWLAPLMISVVGLCSCEYINVTVSDTNVTFKNANNACGGKPYGLDKTGKLDLTDIHVLNHTGPLHAWISANVQLSPWINITGCFLNNYPVSRIKDDGVDISNVSNPIEACFDHCSSDEFAITATKCYCLNNRTYLNGIPCLGHTCGLRNDSLCGHNNTCMCHYKQLRTDPAPNMTGNCMTIRKINDTYIYTPHNCSHVHTVLCTYTNQSGIAVYGDKSLRSWSGVLSICDYNCQWLLGLNAEKVPYHSHKLNENLFYWIGMFRLQHFHWGDSQINNGQCVSIHIISNTETVPDVRLRNCSTKLPVLCGQSDNNQNPPSIVHNPSDIPPSSSSSPTSTGVPLPPVIGSTAGIVLIVLIISVGCLIKRRTRQNENHKGTESHSSTNVAVDADSSRYVDMDDHHFTTYSELSKNYDEPIPAEDDYAYNHLHSADRGNKREDNLYHHTNDFRSEYDSLEEFNHSNDDQTESEYDHIKTKSKLSSSAHSGNYDTMEELYKGKDASVDDTYDHM